MLKSIALAIQKYAQETPERIAVIANDIKCDYKTLAENNRKAALYLEKRGTLINLPTQEKE